MVRRKWTVEDAGPYKGIDGAVRREQAPALRCHSEGAKRPWESKFCIVVLDCHTSVRTGSQ